MKGMMGFVVALATTMSLGVGVAQANVAPTIGAPASLSVNEDTALALTLLSFGDADAGGAAETVTLSVDSGRLASNPNDLTVTGWGTSRLTLRGTVSALDAAFGNGDISYLDAPNANGAHTLHVAIDDEGNTGGAPETAEADVPLNVAAVNDAPYVTTPGGQQSADQDLPYTFAGANKISVGDVDAGTGALQLTLTAAHGTLTLSGTSGLSFATGTGTGDATMTFTGVLSDLDAALDGLVYTPAAGYHGADSLQISADDLGNTGAGGSRTGTAAVAIDVRSPTPYITDISPLALSNDGRTYVAGEHVQLAVRFSRPVYVGTWTGHIPALLLNTAPYPVQAEYESGSGSSVVIFGFWVERGDRTATLDVASGAALQLNGGQIDATDRYIPTLLTTPLGAAAGSLASHAIHVAAGTGPVVTGVDVPADRDYGPGAALDLRVHYDHAVTVTGGTPSISMWVGNFVHGATLIAGSGTDTLTFRYTVQHGDSTDGPNIFLGIDFSRVITLGGATIADGSGNVASRRLSSGDTDLPFVRVDATSPYVLRFAHTEDLSWTLTFNKAVTGVAASDFDVVTTGTARAGSVSVEAGADGKTYKITVHDVTGEGSLWPRLKDGAGTIVDGLGNLLDPAAVGAIGDAYTYAAPPGVPPVVRQPEQPQPQTQTQTPVTPQLPIRTAPAAPVVAPRLEAAAIASSCTRARTLALTLAGSDVARVEVKVVRLKASARQHGCTGLGALKAGRAVGKAKRLTLKSGTNHITYRHGLRPGAYLVTFTPIAADGTRGTAVTRRIRILK